MSKEKPKMYSVDLSFVVGERTFEGYMRTCERLGYGKDIQRCIIEGAMTHFRAVDKALNGHDIISRNVLTGKEEAFALWSTKRTPDSGAAAGLN